MKRLILLVSALLLTGCATVPGEADKPGSPLQWSHLPPLPDPAGFGGAFSGVSNKALIVAGGANFPAEKNGERWGEGEKVWHDRVFVLEPGAMEWRTGFSLPRAMAYGVSVTTPFGVICAGGTDGERAYRDASLLAWVDGRIKRIPLPDLLEPRAGAAGALVGNTIYVAGGQPGPAETAACSTIWTLDLPSGKAPSEMDWIRTEWHEVESWPGPSRSQAVAAAGPDGKFYLFSGFDLRKGPDGKPRRQYLSDAYCFDPKEGWKEIASVPRRAVVSAPAISYGQSHILVFGGHDGAEDALIPELKNEWPGFARDVLAYHTITNTWVKMGEMPVGMVTTNAVAWEGRIVIPGGEIRPRVRTNEVYQAQLAGKKASFGFLNALMLALYLVSLVGMGVYFSKRERTTGDFFLAGRRIPWWAAGISIFGTQLSSISFMAIPAKVYETNWLYFMGAVCIALVQPIVVFFYLPFFRRLNITSAYEYLEKRFNVCARIFGSLSFILFQCGRMTIVLFLPALALAAVTGMNIYWCIAIMGALATFYTVLGGIEAVVWTDVLQVVVLIGGAIVALAIIGFSLDGGFAQVIRTGVADGKFHWADLRWDYTLPVLWVVVVGNLFGNMISYSADQAVIQRYLTTKDEKTAAGAIWTNAALVIPFSILWYFLGTSLYVFYKTRPEGLDPTLKTDQVFPLFIAQELPNGVVGIVIAGLFAASMSTLDSSLNSVATAIVTDFYRRFKPSAEEKTCLSLARLVTLLLGVIATGSAMWMAYNRDVIASLWDVYMAVIGLVMGSLTGLFALGIFTRRANGPGALIGAAFGAAALYVVKTYTDAHFFLFAAVGVVACFIVGYVASFLFPEEWKSVDGLTIYTLPERDKPS